MTHFLNGITWTSINWQTVVSCGAILISLWTLLRQRRQERVKNKLDLLDPRFEVHTRTVRFIQALYESPQFVRSPAFSEIHKDFILAMKRSKMLFDSAVADLLTRINLESFKIKAAKEHINSTVDPRLVNALLDAEMKAFATIEAAFPQVESAMAPYLSFGKMAN
jgi:hypothetical protein